MGGFDFTMQVQVGCPGACLFCYLLDEAWQKDRLQEARSVFGANRVFVGQDGLTSLTSPDQVANQVDRA